MLFCVTKFEWMLKKGILIVAIIGLISAVSCAKRGSITGGAKDTLAPVLVGSFPKNFSTNSKANLIKLVFDEYVKLKNVNKQLIISLSHEEGAHPFTLFCQ